MKKYKDIFIDFDDTLYDTRGNSTIALHELFEWANLSEHITDVEEFIVNYWSTNMILWHQYDKGEIERGYLMTERFRRPLCKCAKSENFNPSESYCIQLSDKFLKLCSDKPGVLLGAHELAEYLKDKGYHLHICSNGFNEIQYKKLKACGLIDFFDTVVLSEDAGVNKPSPKFFDYALQKAGASRETTIMIGDNYNTDILGALNSGIDAILYNRWDPTFVPPTKVTHVVNKLLDIKDIL